MINIVIYLKKNYDYVLLVEKLLAGQLIASPSADQNNESFLWKDGVLSGEFYNVLIAQTE